MTSTADDIRAECRAIEELLLAKNEAYGDSMLNPLRIFSKASPVEQILVRIDDKLSRLVRGDAAGEDVVLDTIGYLVGLRIAERRAREHDTEPPQEQEQERERNVVVCSGFYSSDPTSGCGWMGMRAALENGCCPVCGGGHFRVAAGEDVAEPSRLEKLRRGEKL